MSGPDDVYKFTLGEKSEVDALVSGFHTVMYLRTSCPDAANELECNDDWTLVNYDSRIVRRLEPGTYFLFVDG